MSGLSTSTLEVLVLNSGIDISISYIDMWLPYRNIDMYFEYRDIFRYFSGNWKKGKLKKVERRNVKFKNQRSKFRQIF